MKSVRYAVAILAVLASGLPDWAEAQLLPKTAGRPTAQSIDATGTVDHINLQEGKLVVGDSTYTVTENVAVILPSGGITNIGTLRKGTHVGISIDPLPQQTWPRITRIWVLPKDFVLPEK